MLNKELSHFSESKYFKRAPTYCFVCSCIYATELDNLFESDSSKNTVNSVLKVRVIVCTNPNELPKVVLNFLFKTDHTIKLIVTESCTEKE